MECSVNVKPRLGTFPSWPHHLIKEISQLSNWLSCTLTTAGSFLTLFLVNCAPSKTRGQNYNPFCSQNNPFMVIFWPRFQSWCIVDLAFFRVWLLLQILLYNCKGERTHLALQCYRPIYISFPKWPQKYMVSIQNIPLLWGLYMNLTWLDFDSGKNSKTFTVSVS